MKKKARITVGTVVLAQFAFPNKDIKLRPFVVVSSEEVHKVRKVVVCSITTQKLTNPYPNEYVLAPSDANFQATLLKKECKVSTHSFYTVNRKYITKVLGKFEGTYFNHLKSIATAIHSQLLP